jgi:hypothetical protein
MTTKQKAIEHYERMIEWAKTQDGSEKTDYFYMEARIDESLSGWYCSYCIKNDNVCLECELKAEAPSIRQSCCCGGLWTIMGLSETWSEWITNANKVLDYIREKG